MGCTTSLPVPFGTMALHTDPLNPLQADELPDSNDITEEEIESSIPTQGVDDFARSAVAPCDECGAVLTQSSLFERRQVQDQHYIRQKAQCENGHTILRLFVTNWVRA